MPHEPSLIVRVRQDSRLEHQLRDEPPTLLAQGNSVSLDPVASPSSGAGTIEPPRPGQVVYALPSPEGLVRERQELHDAVSGAPHGDEPLVIVIEAGNELRDDELEAAVRAADTTSRPVILTVLRDG
jgi:hypothetical protein